MHQTKFLGKNTPYQTPYYIFKGETAEPMVLLEAGIHGDEIAGIKALEWLVCKIDVLAGTLIVFPKMNILACKAEKRFINQDLNKVFPGKASGEPYELDLAHQIFQMVGRENVQYLITLHESKYLHDPKEEQTYGQTIVYGVNPMPDCLVNWIEKINKLKKNQQETFYPYYYPIETSSTETLVQNYNLKGGFCVETWRGFNLSRRIELHKNVIFSFFDIVNIRYRLFKNQ
jgi:uncharacterized protein